MAGIEKGEPMTIETDNEVSITIEFDEAVQTIAYLSDLLEFFEKQNLDKAAKKQTGYVRTAKEICEAFVCEHFQKELGDE